MDRAPDLTLTLRDHGFVSIVNARDVVLPRARVAGTHHPHGVLLAYGPGIRRGAMTPTYNVLDVAPMMLHSLGLAVPDEYEGRVPEDLYEEEHLQRHPPLVETDVTAPEPQPSPAPAAGQPEMDEPEEALILERLKALGYIE